MYCSGISVRGSQSLGSTLFRKRSGRRKIDRTTVAAKKSFLERRDFLAQGDVF